METKSQQMITTIESIIQLLKMSNGPDAKYFGNFLVYTLNQLNKPHELHKIAENILKIYGGMGSFNDITIFANGEYLNKEGDEFDASREKLFKQCNEAIQDARK